jgi:6-phosphogluconolactonase
MNANWKSYGDVQAAADACAMHIRSLLEMPLAGGSDATVAFSGGSTPKLMFASLVRMGIDWSRVQVYLVDERPVPPDHPDSNYRTMSEHLVKPARIPSRNVHRIHSELLPQQAARHYQTEIRDCFALDDGELPHFDVIHLGIGADAHTASLFPGEPLIDNREGIAAAVNVDKLSQWRVTLLPGVLLAARHAAVLATGADKARAMRNILREEYAPQKYPAQMIAHNSRRATWFLDDASAAMLD